METGRLNSPLLIYKLHNSIMTVIYKKDLTVDLTLAKQLVQERLAYYKGKSYPTLAEVRHAKLFTKEARDYLAKGDAIRGIPALAILTGNYLTGLMANFFMSFSKPAIPTKIFKTNEQAMRWLSQFVVAD